MTTLVPLSRLATYLNGRAFKPEEKTPAGLPVIRIRQMVDPTADCDYYDGPVQSRHLVSDGDLLFSWSATLAVCMWQRGPAVLNQHLFNVHPVAGVDKRWLRWGLVASIDHFLGMMHGSAMTHITKEMLRDVRLPLPSLDEQRRIADYLDHQVEMLDRAVALRQQQRALAVEKESASLGRLIDEAFEAGSVPLKRLSRGIEQGSSPQCDAIPAEGDEWGVLKLSAVKRGRFKGEENKRIPDGVTPMEAYEVKDGDLLVTRANTPQLVGDVAVARNVPPHRQLCDLIYRVRLDDGVVPEFVAATLLSPRLRSLVPALARGSSASMIKLRGDDILGLPMPALSTVQQRRLVAEHQVMTERNDRLVALLDESLALLRERKQALITAVVSKAVDVSTARSAA